ncbi:hypothetical protein SFUMM280S_11502 [Streptomyces fumanus]
MIALQYELGIAAPNGNFGAQHPGRLSKSP